jgi:hypothetical protein
MKKNTSNVVLPYEPQFTGHREAERRRAETRAWLNKRERQLAEKGLETSIAPEQKEKESTASPADR